ARLSKRGKVFYSCDNYPKCDFMSWDLPIEQTCPECKQPLYCKVNKDKLDTPHCINAECPTNKKK
ncbi:MAG: topoisomerase DNA-binding C4 zinc finger domain-containing protein, partial [Clostridia bacterium]|nr:topoisomerase DNA-binding C4 zinc finger domain-containing protein [Clostridia bacterium]